MEPKFKVGDKVRVVEAGPRFDFARPRIAKLIGTIIQIGQVDTTVARGWYQPQALDRDTVYYTRVGGGDREGRDGKSCYILEDFLAPAYDLSF